MTKINLAPPRCPWDENIYTTPCPKHGGMLADCPMNQPTAGGVIVKIAALPLFEGRVFHLSSE